jgi:hypothetical protein
MRVKFRGLLSSRHGLQNHEGNHGRRVSHPDQTWYHGHGAAETGKFNDSSTAGEGEGSASP